MGFQCAKCHYKQDKENKIPARCPYCSSVGTIRKTQTAQDLLNSINDEIDVVEQSKRERASR